VRVAAFLVGGEARVGVISADGRAVEPFDLASDRAAQGVAGVIDLGDLRSVPRLSPIPLSETQPLAPVPRPRRNIFCVGKNYHDHAREFSASGFDSSAAQGVVPKDPIIFSKVPECVVAHGARVEIDPAVTQGVDYEAELAVIIGRGGRGIGRDEAMGHVWGYTIVNDVTARDLQGRHSQWLIGKSLDTFCPMGPVAVPRDRLDLSDTAITCRVNGELRQDANTRDLIFSVPDIIATISAGITLLPGDIIATGTPAGVGIGFSPPRYLRHGDVVRIEIGAIGVLENTFVERAR